MTTGQTEFGVENQIQQSFGLKARECQEDQL